MNCLHFFASGLIIQNIIERCAYNTNIGHCNDKNRRSTFQIWKPVRTFHEVIYVCFLNQSITSAFLINDIRLTRLLFLSILSVSNITTPYINEKGKEKKWYGKKRPSESWHTKVVKQQQNPKQTQQNKIIDTKRTAILRLFLQQTKQNKNKKRAAKHNDKAIKSLRQGRFVIRDFRNCFYKQLRPGPSFFSFLRNKAFAVPRFVEGGVRSGRQKTEVIHLTIQRHRIFSKSRRITK